MSHQPVGQDATSYFSQSEYDVKFEWGLSGVQALAPASDVIIAAGERWPGGLLRPAVEDLLGAGAIIAYLPGRRSPESELAVAALQHAASQLLDLLRRCGSGKELIGRGFREDVRLASQLDVSRTAPLLVDGAYRAT